MSNASAISRYFVLSLEYAITAALVLAALWIGALAVKHQRKEHLFWIIPFTIAHLESVSIPYVAIVLLNRMSMPITEVRLIEEVISLITRAISLFAMTALVIVIWKSLDQGQTARS